MSSNLMERCVRCGTCHAACPVFQLTRDEGKGARGRIAILQQLYRDGREFSRETLRLLQDCVMCGSCQFSCPRDVPYLDLMRVAREQSMRDGQESPLKRLALKLLKQDAAWNTMNTLLRVLPGESGLVCKLPLVSRLVPRPGEKLDNRIHSVNGNGNEVPENTVLFFPGCTMRYVFPETGERLVALLNHAGLTVLFEPEIGCCGFPQISAGDRESAEELAANHHDRMIPYRNRVSCVVTGCATCGSRLKETVPEGMKVFDINELLVARGDRLRFKRTPEATVLYHPPCHLAKGQHVVNEPLMLLDKIVTPVHLDENPSCCGFGGSFSLFESELSRRIADTKIAKIKHYMEQTGTTAEMVTSCPGCMLQLMDGLARHGSNMKVKHIVDILFEKLEAKE